MFTVHSSRFTVGPSPFYVHGSRSCLAVADSAKADHGLGLAIRHWSSVIGHWSLVIGLVLSAVPRAAADDDAETRLRENLRSTILQLRDAQNQIAVLQGAQADCDQKSKALSDQIALLKKHASEDKTVADTAIATLTAKAATQGAELAQFKDALEKWKADDHQAHDDARVAQAEKTKLAGDNILLQRRVDYLEKKNVELFKVGNEILDRYSSFSLGNALAAKEPFVGTSRTKLENLLQDYQDKLLDGSAAP
jgi:chromosome segregation ATPase